MPVSAHLVVRFLSVIVSPPVGQSIVGHLDNLMLRMGRPLGPEIPKFS
jgi:hypothetical protein